MIKYYKDIFLVRKARVLKKGLFFKYTIYYTIYEYIYYGLYILYNGFKEVWRVTVQYSTIYESVNSGLEYSDFRKAFVYNLNELISGLKIPYHNLTSNYKYIFLSNKITELPKL